MHPLRLHHLTEALLPAAVALDQQCLGGMWSLDSYRQELERPQSLLLGLVSTGAEPAGGGSTDGKPANGGPAGDRFADGEPADGKPADGKPADGKPADGKPANGKPTGDRLADGKPANGKPAGHEPANHDPGIQEQFPGSPQAAVLNPEPVPWEDIRLQGLACLWSVADEAHINMLAIAPDYQGRGWGQVLLAALLLAAYDRGLEWATLEVSTQNSPALRLYHKFGFQTLGIRKGYYRHSGDDAAILWLKHLQEPATLARLRALEQQGWDRVGPG
ncbi:GNAT family N-acetyltransferase [Prochlorothrix hollandica]|uniref:GNAT family N-acetyltransferase n=1 Tax=Prochlorothrix hollandica TaxID=1223 RepID=UPI003342B590